jgi:hypothetical protein
MTFTFKSDNNEEVEKGLYFIKGLPLAHTFDIDELEENIDDVFHEHNKRILFTLSTLSADFSLEENAEEVEYDYHVERDNIIYTDKFKKAKDKKKDEEEKDKKNQKQKEASKKSQIKPAYPDDQTPEPDMSKSYQRDSDLLGLATDSKEGLSSSINKVGRSPVDEDDDDYEDKYQKDGYDEDEEDEED